MEDYSSCCLDCGYPLDGLKSSSCPECGRAFDRENPQSYQRVIIDPILLARAPLAEAVSARLALERNNIPATVQQEVGGLIGYAEVPQGSLWVSRSNEARARIVLGSLVARPVTGEPWTCPVCHEVIDGQFDACWNCNADRYGATKEED